jgi:hypothetical protein
VKRVEFEATVCSDNTFHDDLALSSMKQVCTAFNLVLFQSTSLLKFYSVEQHHGEFDTFFQFLKSKFKVPCVHLHWREIVGLELLFDLWYSVQL